MYNVHNLVVITLHGESMGHNYLCAIMFRWLYWKERFKKYVEVFLNNADKSMWELIHLFSQIPITTDWNIFPDDVVTNIETSEQSYINSVAEWNTSSQFTSLIQK
jgi:hypothetical protein